MAYNAYVVNKRTNTYTLVSNIETISHTDVTVYDGSNYRDTGWLLGQQLALSKSVDDGTVISGSEEARIPDELMHVAPRNEARKITLRNYNCTGSKVFSILLEDWSQDCDAEPEML